MRVAVFIFGYPMDMAYISCILANKTPCLGIWKVHDLGVLRRVFPTLDSNSFGPLGALLVMTLP